MRWYNDTEDIFSKVLADFFIKDRYNKIIFPGFNSEKHIFHGTPPKFCTKCHMHPEAEIIIMLDGECLIEHEGMIYELKKGDIGVVNGNSMHRELARDLDVSYTNAYIAIEGNKAWFFVTRYEKRNEFKWFHASPILILKDESIIKQILVEVKEKSHNFEAFFYCFLKAFYLYILRSMINNNPRDITVDNVTFLTLEITEYIKNNYMNREIIKDMCKYLNMSEPSICNFFKKNLNITMSQFINYVRVSYAKCLLKQVDMKVSDIAYDLGYSDQYHFSKVFKSHVGATPTEFRQSPADRVAYLFYKSEYIQIS